MKIAFITANYDASDITRGSGTYYFMSREIERQGHSVSYIGPIEAKTPYLTRLLKKLSTMTGSRYRTFQDIFMARAIGKVVTQKLRSLDIDSVITNDYAVAGYTNIAKPIILYTDAIFPHPYRDNRHPWLENLSPISVKFSEWIIRRALHKVHFCAYPSAWAIQQAYQYSIEGLANKIGLIRFGANLFDPPTSDIAASRSFANIVEKGCIDVLYIGNRDWELKGGSVAVETISALHQRGINACLHIVGPYPDNLGAEDPSSIKTYGVIDKSIDIAPLLDLYCQCDVLLLPTKAEGFGVAFIEAAAYGMPSLSYRTIGVSTAVKDGQSGILLELGSEAASFADTIARWFVNPEAYDNLVIGARTYYEQEANWEHAVETLLAKVSQTLTGRA